MFGTESENDGDGDDGCEAKFANLCLSVSGDDGGGIVHDGEGVCRDGEQGKGEVDPSTDLRLRTKDRKKLRKHQLSLLLSEFWH